MAVAAASADKSAGMYPAFTFARGSAVSGRNAIAFAPSMPACYAAPPATPAPVTGDVHEVADALAGLASALSARLREAAGHAGRCRRPRRVPGRGRPRRPDQQTARQGRVMPGAVFGDFLAAASEHLEAAVTVREEDLTRPPAVAEELSRLVAVMSRYCDDLAPCDQVEASGRDDLHPWERAAIDAAGALRIASGCVRRASGQAAADQVSGTAVPQRAQHLAAAASRACGGQGPAAHPPSHRSGRADASEVGMGVRGDVGSCHTCPGARDRAIVPAARAVHGVACCLVRQHTTRRTCPAGLSRPPYGTSSRPQASGCRLPVPLCAPLLTPTRCGQPMPNCCARSPQSWCRSEGARALPGNQ